MDLAHERGGEDGLPSGRIAGRGLTATRRTAEGCRRSSVVAVPSSAAARVCGSAAAKKASICAWVRIGVEGCKRVAEVLAALAHHSGSGDQAERVELRGGLIVVGVGDE